MPPATSRPQQVSKASQTFCIVTNAPVDDIKDIYQRAEGHELVVEGLRDGQFNVEA
jgi:putative SOS response-associated peptidase YedK